MNSLTRTTNHCGAFVSALMNDDEAILNLVFLIVMAVCVGSFTYNILGLLS